MARGDGPAARENGAGARIRARRLALGLKQVETARAAGISASYLNLIERGRRPIGGKLLSDVAAALGVPPAELREGPGRRIVGALARAATLLGPRPAADPASADEMAGRYPGWAGLIAAQDDRIAELERTVAALSDRLGHDPVLSASVHNVLSSVTAIRSTAGILAGDETLDAQWLARFHRNLHEDSRKLADTAQALAAYLTAGEAAQADAIAPQEVAELWLARHDAGETAPEPEGAAGWILRRQLARRAEDARALPDATLAALIARHGPDPFAVAAGAGCALDLAMRRLGTLPEAALGAPVGLVVCDAAGALTYRRAAPGFEIPRFGAACALWPVFEALHGGPRPVARRLRQGGREQRPLRAWAVAVQAQPDGFDRPGTAEATMLVVPEDLLSGRDAPRAAPVEIGSTCRLCAVARCAARREPSVLAPDGVLTAGETAV
ncbi:XRE family transcriptional regulator [Palleronia sediminis]|uniref:XRE family transcriptional regulator n=1 Tax=Palleronia sediminis TaxID=2547833 RepID=A0A4R6AE14_9RHOB|nr:XRE family transcriptional regulator [Palleronia sediminis]TDL79696.1 XRE family transcriptional regulator [Palleronia sediminis]